MPFKAGWKLRLRRPHAYSMGPAVMRWLFSQPHDGPVDPPFVRHADLRIDRPNGATMVVGVDAATGGFVLGQQVGGKIQLLQHGFVRVDPENAPKFWDGVSAPPTPWNSGYQHQAMRHGLLDLEAPVELKAGQFYEGSFRVMPGQDVKVSRMVYEGPPVNRYQFTSSGPAVPLSELVSPEESARTPGVKVTPAHPEGRIVGIAQVCSMGDNPLAYWTPGQREVDVDLDAGRAAEAPERAGEPDAPGGS